MSDEKKSGGEKLEACCGMGMGMDMGMGTDYVPFAPQMPVMQSPTMETPMMETPMTESPMMQMPMMQMPMMETPMMESPMMQMPMMQPPMMQAQTVCCPFLMNMQCPMLCCQGMMGNEPAMMGMHHAYSQMMPPCMHNNPYMYNPYNTYMNNAAMGMQY